MKLGTVEADGTQRVAVALDDTRAVLLAPGTTVAGLIGDWANAGPAVELAAQAGAEEAVPVASLSWLPPLPRPGKIICVALNNSANASRIMSGPGHPATFSKPASSLLGHGRPVRLKKEFGRVHPEPELAVVIGTKGADIPLSRAMDHVFGYTIINDLTSPDMRTEDTFHYRAIHPAKDGGDGIEYVDTWVSYSGRYKGTDGFGPIGPWIVTADEIPDPHDLTVTCVHQGRVITVDSTANLTHKVDGVISFLSGYQTLEPGDIIAMGTALKASASGGAAVQNVNLTRLGGPIEVTISGIGTLSNPVEMP
ncbi:FAA hydrolase family protein [Trebonia kvetii]|uniref:FAA hydrolase family protein n=1 Tax=Trebonia kvetii TaxID=2480626 RepID=A0A6P2C4R9_9ACTN|nr:fumarylacetoacetate hydrolase family protein [Trebonia kvetii]TVZ04503.1 FAA hydrolase family protein [Trebonia kvetii]